MMKTLQLTFLSIISAAAFFGNAKAQETTVFSEATGSRATVNNAYDYEKWSFSIDEFKYEINKNGIGKRMKGDNSVDTFRFSIEDADYIDRVIYFSKHKDDLLLIGELSFGDAGGGFIIRLDGKTLETKWRTSIPAFNVAKGLIEGNAAYLAGVGFVSKINLETGKYIWKHDDLYRKFDESGAFNIFLTPKIKNDLIIFKEDDILYRGFDRQIILNKSSGEIIKVLLN